MIWNARSRTASFRMRRSRAASIVLLALLAGCTVASGPASTDALRFGDLDVRFQPAHDDQVIEIHALDGTAISAASLILKNGTSVPAYSVVAESDPTDRSRQEGGMAASVTLIGQVASTALIRVPNPADYAADWRQAHVEIIFGFGKEMTTRTVQAPPPV